MDSDYKLHVKLGSSEFNGEGPESAVKEAYEQFLQALSTVHVAPPPPDMHEKTLEKPSGVDQRLLDKAFLKEDQFVSLKHLPPDSATRAADAAILIIYGFKKLLGQDDVPVTKLNEGLRKSGLSLDRVDRFLGVHSQFYRKGGQKSGGRYTLNNQGELKAEGWLKDWFN
jgi:hypothetical protein